jgi:hypothetical protein
MGDSFIFQAGDESARTHSRPIRGRQYFITGNAVNFGQARMEGICRTNETGSLIIPGSTGLPFR